ncbi:hypothetical protein [Pseudomonas syringae]|uniref:hypothetical protein n=1 Tax=Pseudomonas syringae TaxID=317 RepID=UPI001372FC75|nr:hypothetical protein [Pseudomonas syringae]NAP32572.1 hypothetical protein [Pseudomonas syringae]
MYNIKHTGQKMRLADAIPLRLTVEKRELYEAQAAAAELPLSTFLRNRLEREDLLLDEIQMLRRALERVADNQEGPPKDTVNTAETMPVLLEILLTMRQLGGQKTVLAQKELQRQGINIWSAET